MPNWSTVPATNITIHYNQIFLLVLPETIYNLILVRIILTALWCCSVHLSSKNAASRRIFVQLRSVWRFLFDVSLLDILDFPDDTNIYRLSPAWASGPSEISIFHACSWSKVQDRNFESLRNFRKGRLQ